MPLYLFAKPLFSAQLCIYSVLSPPKIGLFPTFSARLKLFELFIQFDMVQSTFIVSACAELSGSLAQFDSNNLRTSEAVSAIVALPAAAHRVPEEEVWSLTAPLSAASPRGSSLF